MQRDARKDKFGNLYLPNVMNSDGSIPPPRGQWAFLQSIYPGQVQDQKDPLVLGSLKMLEAAEVEGLPLESGWMNNGVWPCRGVMKRRFARDGGRGKVLGCSASANALHERATSPAWRRRRSAKQRPPRQSPDFQPVCA